jgi:hypothetical protein
VALQFLAGPNFCGLPWDGGSNTLSTGPMATAPSPPFFAAASTAGRGCASHFLQIEGPNGLSGDGSCAHSLGFLAPGHSTSRTLCPAELACSYLAPRALGSNSTPIQRLVERFHANAMACGVIPRAFPMVRPRPGVRWLRAKCLDGPRWPSSPSLAVLMARLPRRTLSLDFLAPAFPGELVRVLF